jgi:hypothetical protein
MVRLDRTIGLSKLSLTGTFALMARSSRTMTVEQDDTPLDALFERPWGSRPEDQPAEGQCTGRG